jgi:hypothetical protein
VGDISIRAAPHDESSDPTGAACPVCERTGFVYVSPFRWAGERHLNWFCRACGYVWVFADRRGKNGPRAARTD